MSILVNYVRRTEVSPSGVVSEVPFATVVAVGKQKVGMSFCHPEDTFRKKIGRTIAIGRAYGGVAPEYPKSKGKTGLSDADRRNLAKATVAMFTRSNEYYK